MLRSKAFQQADYADGSIRQGLSAWAHGYAWFQGQAPALRFMPSVHRSWEYGSLLQALHEHGPIKSALDVGCGDSCMSPGIGLAFTPDILEVDLASNVTALRTALMTKLSTRIGSRCEFRCQPLLEVEGSFDAVTAISMMEDIHPSEQEASWRKLAALVAPGGVLAVTIDYGPAPQGWGRPEDRQTFFHAAYLEEKILPWLRSEGITLGEVDPTFHETIDDAPTPDYTFARIIGAKS